MLQWFISFHEFTEFNESSTPFRKNSIVLSEIKFYSTIDQETFRPCFSPRKKVLLEHRIIPVPYVSQKYWEDEE